jgi:ATP-dependent Zn protease
LELKQTAIHEAGHVVVAHVLGLACKDVALTHYEVEETGAYGYANGPNPAYGYEHASKRERQETMRAEAIACCAGLAAEHVFFGVALSTDNENAQGDFRNIIQLEGDGLRIRSKSGGTVGDGATWCYISGLLIEARRLVERHRDAIHRLADILVEKNTIGGEEVGRLLRAWT